MTASTVSTGIYNIDSISRYWKYWKVLTALFVLTGIDEEKEKENSGESRKREVLARGTRGYW